MAFKRPCLCRRQHGCSDRFAACHEHGWVCCSCKAVSSMMAQHCVDEHTFSGYNLMSNAHNAACNYACTNDTCRLSPEDVQDLKNRAEEAEEQLDVARRHVAELEARVAELNRGDLTPRPDWGRLKPFGEDAVSCVRLSLLCLCAHDKHHAFPSSCSAGISMYCHFTTPKSQQWPAQQGHV